MSIFTHLHMHFYSFIVAPLLLVTFEYVFTLYFVMYLCTV